MENDSDKLFLLSLLQNFRMTPASRKPSVKIAIINAISNGLYSPSLSPLVLSSHYAPSIPYNAHQPEYMYSTQKLITLSHHSQIFLGARLAPIPILKVHHQLATLN